MQKRIVALMLAIACVLSLASCKKAEYNGEMLRYNMLSDAKNLDPQLASDNSSALILANIMEGLMTLDEQGDFALGVAEIVSIDDTQKKYTFTLRDSVKWSDYTAVTADDFVFAFRRLFDPQTKSKTAPEFFCIKNAQKVYNGEVDVTNLGVYNQGGKVVFELERKTPEFLSMLTLPQAMPCKESFFYETKGRYGTDSQYLLYNGPYYLKAWYKGEQIAIRKNETYHDKDNVYSGGVNFFPMDDAQEIAKDFANKKSDVVIIEQENYTKGLGKYKSVKQSMTTWGILCNLNDSFFSNDNIRKALAQSFDNKVYEKHLEDSLQATSEVLASDLILGESPYSEIADKTKRKADISTAKQSYKKGLYECKLSGFITKSMIVPQGIAHKEYFDYISMIWQKELSLFINIEQLPQDEYNRRIENGEYELAIYQLTSDGNTVSGALEGFTSGTVGKIGAISGFSNKSFDLAYEKLISAQSQNEYESFAKNMVDIIEKENVFLPLYSPIRLLAYQKNISGVFHNSQNDTFSFKYAYKK